MTEILQKYSILAGLFDYPDQKTDDLLDYTSDILQAQYSSVIDTFRQFGETIRGMDLHSREEYFVRTFEVEALISMDLGYILFGEDYKRGNFLAMMQQEQTEAGNNLGSELADHLPNVMRLLPLMSEQHVAEELAYSIMFPAISEILKKFENTDNVYQYAFETVLKVMEKDFSGLPYEVYQVRPDGQSCAGDEYACGADFLHEIGKQKF